jgi:tripartite-type tricarboxylate transporter receptor subunit TctC
MMTDRRRLLQAALGATFATGGRLAAAQPVEQLRILFGVPPGSAGDSLSRRLAEKFAASAYIRHAAVVENRAGAGSRIALEALRASTPHFVGTLLDGGRNQVATRLSRSISCRRSAAESPLASRCS